MVDIDKFLQVNEKFGYQIGDFVLIQVAKMIRDTICGGDLLGRFEQDKFIIMPHSGFNKEKMYLLCEQIRNTIENLKIGAAKNPIKITVSIGFHISGIENDDFNKTFNDLTERTAQALNYAKKRKGNQTASLL